MLYALALGTGFRAKELRTLTPERFNLDSDTPTVMGKSCYTKNGREAVQPLAPPWRLDFALGLPGRPLEGPCSRG